VILIDANLLLYAYHPRSPHHERSRTWIESVFCGLERLSWSSVLAFLRIGTNPRAFEHPLSMAEAQGAVSSWFELSAVDVIEPGERYWPILRELLLDAQVSGPLVTDAALAALAIEHGATLCTNDRDFSASVGLSCTIRSPTFDRGPVSSS
jgi:uncharacterized protein